VVRSNCKPETLRQSWPFRTGFILCQRIELVKSGYALGGSGCGWAKRLNILKFNKAVQDVPVNRL
jgi:hypothetical protein